MAMKDDSEDEQAGIPEWVVTFGDMMSLLLTFFIMLVSLSEVKEEEKFQALVESMRRRFGYAQTIDSAQPGPARPRTAAKSPLATMGRAKRLDVKRGGVPDKAPVGEERRVRIIRPGRPTSVGTVVFFSVGSDRLDDPTRRILDEVAGQLKGKPQKIEVRGHVAPDTAGRVADPSYAMDLAHARGRNVMQYLVETHAIERSRFRLSAAGEHEPMHAGSDPEQMRRNPRVEVFLLDETVDELRGTSGERAAEEIAEDDDAAERNHGG